MLDARALARAERVLGARRREAVVLRQVDEFRPGRVARCTVHGRNAHDGDSVIVKVPGNGDGRSPDLAAVHNEHAALHLLQLVGSGAAPTLLAADDETGVLVLEDLGDGPSLATALLSGDAAAAEAAAVASAWALGTLHAQTVGFADRYYEVRARLGRFDREADLFTLRGVDLRSCIAHLPSVLDDQGLPGLARRSELDAVLQELAEPGDFLALSSGDPCPDNGRIGATGVRFFDFEVAAFRHALVDAAHYVIPFPNCWCWRRLPEDVASRMLDAHRERLATSSVQAADGVRYGSALTRVSAAWAIWTLHRRLPHVAVDQPARTRIVEALSGFARCARDYDQLPKLGQFCDHVATIVRDRWSVADTDTYPAFGGAPWQPPR